MDANMDSSTPPEKLKAVENYVVFHPRECGLIEVFQSLFPDAVAPSLRCTPSLRSKVDASWQAKFAMFMITVLHSVVHGLGMLGHFIELWLNTFNLNGGLFKLVFSFLSGAVFGNFTKMEVPRAGSETYLSVVGLMDPRTDLLIHKSSGDNFMEASSRFGLHDVASKLIADTCMMASKLAYENANVIEKVVREEWKMNLVGVFTCLNKYLVTNPTQLYIFTDSEEDAEAIVIAFRGTGPFNAYDWSISFDFSWYELPDFGRVHVGVMEALGLIDRQDMSTFSRLRRNAGMKVLEKEHKEELVVQGSMDLKPENKVEKHKPLSGLLEAAHEENIQLLAYDIACATLKELLAKHKKAKVYITGHSLGGSLSTMFAGMLYYSREDLITQRLAAIYTFGQPRVGDREFASSLASKLNDPQNRYFRVVYASDLLPRIPYEDLVFQFRHLGPCFYYSSSYQQETVNEQPNKNFSASSLLPDHASATFEVLQSFLLRYKFGDSYKETLACTIFRLVGILFPGVAAHSPVNYINAMRLGPDLLDHEVMPSFENRVMDD